MANTKNSQAAKIRKQIIAWLQDEQQTEEVSATKFPGIRGIRAVKLREMLGALGYAASVVMGAVSAAPSIDHRIQKAALKPREVYYYFDASVPAKALAATSTPVAVVPASHAASAAAPAAHPSTPLSTRAAGLASTDAFATLQRANAQVGQAVDALLTAAQDQAPLDDLELDFLSDLAAQTAKQTELLQSFAIQDRIAQLRRKER